MNAKKPAKPAKPATKKTGKLSVKEEAVGVKAGAATAVAASAATLGVKATKVAGSAARTTLADRCASINTKCDQ